MRYIVAVSGGVDSVVLLDMLVHEVNHEVIVAHFDHGIRGDQSAADSRFVEALARRYKVPFHVGHGQLSPAASEAEARQKRYDFLFKVAQQYQANLVTAHHADDSIETIAINQYRGTGWRGLAVLGDARITRPLLAKTKAELYDYALQHNLEWVEDATNQTDDYLRNRLRRQLGRLTKSDKESLHDLRTKQFALGEQIDREAAQLLGGAVTTSRYFFIMIDETPAIELLRTLTSRKLTRPQLQRILMAIKTFQAGAVLEAGGGLRVRFTVREFIVENTSGVL
jgi:tRNA(Ile)-lysidine synthase